MMLLRHNHIALYVGTVIFGLFLSSATPTALSLAEHYIDFSGETFSLANRGLPIDQSGERGRVVVLNAGKFHLIFKK